MNHETFLKVKTHLLTQNKKSRDVTGCKYRTYPGLQCAIGCLIPDNEYSVSFENQSVNGIRGRVPALDDMDIGMLGSLQNIHDAQPVKDWPMRLYEFEARYFPEHV